MAAKKTDPSISGQSMLEFLITLPLMVGLAMLMIRVNTVIQMGIVNQQYARAQTLYLAENGANYPQRMDITASLATHKYNQLVVGVSDNQQINGGDVSPVTATTYKIVPSTTTGYNDNARTEANQRGNLRVRTSVTLCLPTIAAITSTPANPGALFVVSGDSPQQFNFCSAPQDYVNDDGTPVKI
jgi:hypothetical protein